VTAVCYLSRHLVTAALTDAGTTLPVVPHHGVCDLAGASVRRAHVVVGVDRFLRSRHDVCREGAA
jgi:hypothetical protein